MILITLPDVVVAVVVAVVVIDGIRPTTVCLLSFKVIFSLLQLLLFSFRFGGNRSSASASVSATSVSVSARSDEE